MRSTVHARGETVDERIAELRDVITANYEDIRTLFDGLRDDDLAKVTASGWPVWKAAGHIVLSQAADVRVAQRLAAGEGATPLRIARLLDELAEWRSMRAFANATRTDLLAAWENSFNALFSCINDLTEELSESDGPEPARHRMLALDYLREAPARRQGHAAEIRRAIGAAAT
jgi:hypothetical protein